MNNRRGIIGAGNWIVDFTKTIDSYPDQDTLANILDVKKSTGGAAYNLLVDLARLGSPFPLAGIGLVGNDPDGDGILKACRDLHIDTTYLLQSKDAGTAYTDVMVVRSTGRRTFFTYRGANAYLDIPHFDFEHLNFKILHLGYPLLLDRLDEFYDQHLTRAAVVLKMAQEHGIITSLDLVSENSDRFRKIILPSLPYTDLLFLNEFEAWKLIGLKINDDLTETVAKAAIQALFKLGVNQWIFLHTSKGALAGHVSGQFWFQPGIALPNHLIKGTPGAGDAFAAGVLYGIHEGWDISKSLDAAVCIAATSLTESGCSDGVKSLKECLALGHAYGYNEFQ